MRAASRARSVVAAAARLPAGGCPSRASLGAIQSVPEANGYHQRDIILKHLFTAAAFSEKSNGSCNLKGQSPSCSLTQVACFSSETCSSSAQATEAVQELYQKMLGSVEARTMPPNALLWSMVASCSNKEDTKLLFQILRKLRIFRLSNLHIHSNFNSHLCMRVAEACTRAGALDYGLKTLREHNVYGLTPTIGSAHYLLRYAEEHNDVKLMENIMQTMQKNSLQVQPTTANIIFRICFNTGRWDLLAENANRFVHDGVKLRRVAFGIWMEYAAKRGDSQSIWKINSLRANTVKKHNLASWFACVKGYLLDGKPRRAANAVEHLLQNFPKKKEDAYAELEKVVKEWPLQVLKRRKKEERSVVAEELKSNISIMLSSLSSKGLDIGLNAAELQLA